MGTGAARIERSGPLLFFAKGCKAQCGGEKCFGTLLSIEETAFLDCLRDALTSRFPPTVSSFHQRMAHVPTIIEKRYQEAVDRLSAREKIAQSFAMFDWARGWIARQIVEERGAMKSERLRWEVALRVYGDDPGARQLIEKHLDRLRHHVSG